MPAIARSRTAPSQSPNDRRSEFEHPTANAFVGEVEAPLGKQLLDIAIAQGEAKVQPHGVLDDDRRKTMPAIGDRSHARSLRRTPPIQQAVFLTVPFVVFDPRARQGPGIGGMKHDSEIGVALANGHPCYLSVYCPIRCRVRRSRISAGPKRRSSRKSASCRLIGNRHSCLHLSAPISEIRLRRAPPGFISNADQCFPPACRTALNKRLIGHAFGALPWCVLRRDIF